jgi:type I restriction enzyme R subunit
MEAAIAARLGELKGNKSAIAETIENNVRKTILKEHLHDPAFYDLMSALLDEIIATRKARAIEYEEYLKRIAELVKKVDAGHAGNLPAALDTPGKRALYNNLNPEGGTLSMREGDAGEPGGYPPVGDPALRLALMLDEGLKQARPDAWRGVLARELVIKRALYDVLRDEAEVERLFVIVKAQSEY